MIVLPQSLVLAPSAGFLTYLPIIGWHNLVTFDGVSADHEDPAYPATNLANDSTNLRWLSTSTALQYVYATLSTSEAVNYVGIARHNFGSTGATITVQGRTAEPDADWVDLSPEYSPAHDRALLFRFANAFLVDIRLKIVPGTGAPSMAIFYVGALLVMERGVDVGHTPLPYARHRKMIAGRSEGGEYLGKIESGGVLRSRVDFNNMSPDFYRDEVDAFVEANQPFFFAWAPDAYPDEVGFAWFVDDVMPVPAHLAGWTNLSIEMEAIL